ncbi:MAG: CRISPR-associated helicase Cas3' [Muribaculaceae bacterium]|nr:CRISPR-associated helicase Cas3' [Muribaculaceae bacterium]
MNHPEKIISHIKESSGKWLIQSNDEHQQGVAILTARFSDSFNMSEWGKVLGLLHDIGKEKHAFQQHIMKESGYQPNTRVEGDYSHAFVGGLVAHKLFPQVTPILSNIIMGHHRGLYDDGDWKELIKQEIPDEVTIPDVKAHLSMPRCAMAREDVHLLVRMLYSCLVDADYLDTEAFMAPEQAELRGSKTTMSELCSKLESHLEKLSKSAPDTEVNRIRRYVQECCKNSSDGDVDYYSLTVPTGGGKTLSSLLWALRHAVRNDLQRIIIAIPYTSIIVQTAATLKAIFGEENVLEHHSNVEYDGDGKNEVTKQLQLATENWDYPIVVTTNVRFFESLFSNKPSQCRKLHNIAKSVVILDEVQTLPLEFLQPIINSFKSLKNVFGTSFLFTTASQPILDGTIRGTNRLNQFEALPHIHEIIPAEANLHDKLRRVKLDINNAPQTYDEIARQIAQHDRVLCIVNTRKDAKELFERLPQEGLTLHLSRMMYPAHVRETIETIKAALKDDNQRIIRVVATQLIEAGVDIDFPIVYRQEAGLDSILQAAGRCNREGKLDICTTHVFSLGAEHQLPPGYISQANYARQNMVGDFDWFAPEAMRAYFSQLLARTQSFDKKQIGNMLYKPTEMQFQEAAAQFRLIEDETTSIFIQCAGSKYLLDELMHHGPSYPVLKKLSQYAVSVRQKDFKALNESGAIIEYQEGIYVLENESMYHDKVGLITDNQWLEETLII